MDRTEDVSTGCERLLVGYSMFRPAKRTAIQGLGLHRHMHNNPLPAEVSRSEFGALSVYPLQPKLQKTMEYGDMVTMFESYMNFMAADWSQPLNSSKIAFFTATVVSFRMLKGWIETFGGESKINSEFQSWHRLDRWILMVPLALASMMLFSALSRVWSDELVHLGFAGAADVLAKCASVLMPTIFVATAMQIAPSRPRLVGLSLGLILGIGLFTMFDLGILVFANEPHLDSASRRAVIDILDLARRIVALGTVVALVYAVMRPRSPMTTTMSAPQKTEKLGAPSQSLSPLG